MRTKCIRYFVDPRLLLEGVSVENLPKQGEEEFIPDFQKLGDLSHWKSDKNSHLFDKTNKQKRG